MVLIYNNTDVAFGQSTGGEVTLPLPGDLKFLWLDVKMTLHINKHKDDIICIQSC